MLVATIRTAIELQDNFTGVLYQVISSVNLGLSAMEDLNQSMNTPLDLTSMEAARDSIRQAAIAVGEWDAAIQGMKSPNPRTPDTAVKWQSNAGPQVFESTGLKRFEQEVQSANEMLRTLNITQEQIAAAAAQTDLFPPAAESDLGTLQNRLQTILQSVQRIGQNPLNMGADAENFQLEKLRGQLNQAVQEQESLNCAVQNLDVGAANAAYLRLSQTIGNTQQYIRDNVDEQGRFNQEIREGQANASRLTDAIKGAVAAYVSIQTLKKGLELSDTLTSTTARLNLMNDNLQTTQELQNMIYLSAQQARGKYLETADAVAKLGLMAGDAFDSSKEVIAFAEQLNKQFVIAGTEASGIDAAMLQLTQAMASGVLRGEEFTSVLEQAPRIIEAIADYMEVPKGKLKEMAAEGKITAGIVKAAVFAAAEETNAKFESMPKTFEQVWNSFENSAIMAFHPVLQRMNEIANSRGFEWMVNNAIRCLSLVANIALRIFNLLTSAAGLVADNWSWLSPIIYGTAAALAVYHGQLLLAKGSTMALAAARGILTGAMMLAVPIYSAVTGATMADTAAQWGLNAALYACPIVWVIISIIALIALFYAAVAAVNHFAGTSLSATGIICGAFLAALAFVGNLFYAFLNLTIDVFLLIYNVIAMAANFIGNVFTDPLGAAARLFCDFADLVLGILQSLASAIDTVFGSNLADAVQGWRDSLSGWTEDTFGKGKEFYPKINAQDAHFGRFDYGSAWDTGKDFGKGIEERVSDLFHIKTNLPSPDDYGANMMGDIGEIAGNTEAVAGNTEAIKDSLDITEEDLRYLRDIAEQEAINRFTTAEITIEQTNHNTVSGKMDLDGIVSGLTDAANEAVDRIAEGVHP